MSNLIFFEDHHPDIAGMEKARRRLDSNSLIPIQLALNENDIERCFSLLTEYGSYPVFPRANPEDGGRILFLLRLADAVKLNQKILEKEVDASAITNRIDLIQMLENCQHSLVSKAWDRIGNRIKPFRAQDDDSADNVGQ